YAEHDDAGDHDTDTDDRSREPSSEPCATDPGTRPDSGGAGRRVRRLVMALAAAGPSALWYLTRATGAVTLVLLPASVGLGIANVGRLQSARWPRFVVEGLHRHVSLLAIAVLAVHIVTTVLDPFASIHAID